MSFLFFYSHYCYLGKKGVIGSGPTLQMTWSRAETLSINCRISSDAGEVIETEQAEVKVTTSKCMYMYM